MQRAACPTCGKPVRLDDDEAMLYERVTCPHCDAFLEVVEEFLLTLAEVED